MVDAILQPTANTQCYKQASGGGHSNRWFSVASYNRPAMVRLTDDSVKKDNADHRADGRS